MARGGVDQRMVLPTPLPDVTWAVEAKGVVLVRGLGEDSLCLGYPEALLWELTVNQEKWETAQTIIAHVAGWEREAARSWALATWDRWITLGWLSRGCGRG